VPLEFLRQQAVTLDFFATLYTFGLRRQNCASLVHNSDAHCFLQDGEVGAGDKIVKVEEAK